MNTRSRFIHILFFDIKYTVISPCYMFLKGLFVLKRGCLTHGCIWLQKLKILVKVTCMHDFSLCLAFYFWWLYYRAADETITPHALYTLAHTQILIMRPAVSLELWKSNLGAEFFLSGKKENSKEEVMVTDDDKQGKYCLVSLAFACSDISLAAVSWR